MNKAIVIGCSKYDDPEIGALQFAHTDAQQFAAALRTYCGIDCDRDIVLLTSPESPGARAATRANITQAIRRLSGSNDDIIFVYFSGHGFKSVSDGKDYLLPCDAVFAHLEYNSIALQDVELPLSDYKSRCVLLFIDACRNLSGGGKSIGAESLPPINPDSLKEKGFARFFSCGLSQRSFEVPELSAGIFTRGLLDGLGELGGCKTVRDLDSYLKSRVPDLGRLHERPIQEPVLRVEPLAMAEVNIVSPDRLLQLTSRLRREIRQGVNSFTRRESDATVVDILAIDFGTSYSLCAIPAENDEIIYIGGPDGKRHIPSAILIMPNMDYIVGRSALDHYGIVSDTLLRGFKREMTSNPKVHVHKREIPLSSIASYIIASIIQNAREVLDSNPRRALAAVPASFSLSAREVVVEAFINAGFERARLISEPCAAAICGYHDIELQESTENDAGGYNVLIVDVGGGTTDVAAVCIDYVDGERQFGVLSNFGDRAVGGIDFDKAIRNLILDRARNLLPEGTTLGPQEEQELEAESERVKIRLSTTTEATVVLSNIESRHGLVDIEIIISRDDLTSVSSALVDRIERCIQNAARASEWTRIDSVMLAGQGCKIWSVRQLIGRMFPKHDIVDKFQETAVISGLAEYARVLLGQRANLLLLDLLPAELSIAYCEDNSEKPILVISSDENLNKEQAAIVTLGTTIPHLHEFDVLLKGPDRIYTISVSETLNGEISALGSVKVLVTPGITKLRISIDIDATSVVYLKVFELPEMKNLCDEIICGRFAAKWWQRP
ncbi:molecular chaperone DnaK [Caballeronia choica]|uniref:Molecular chaperone DnaK n=1 Tax=Caballeronia choica TaxID=326476 RepID=A0A158KZ75_9BURK|nr:Hsp70 family protein [Caballeronia choica]SAL86424.1 molecular chaperone DnaK [Caballeronia choica]